jgi:hypothetical protein
VNEDVAHDVPHRMSPRRCVRDNRLAKDKHLIGKPLHLEGVLYFSLDVARGTAWSREAACGRVGLAQMRE